MSTIGDNSWYVVQTQINAELKAARMSVRSFSLSSTKRIVG